MTETGQTPDPKAPLRLAMNAARDVRDAANLIQNRYQNGSAVNLDPARETAYGDLLRSYGRELRNMAATLDGHRPADARSWKTGGTIANGSSVVDVWMPAARYSSLYADRGLLP